MTARRLGGVAAIVLGAASVSLVAQRPTVTFRSSTGIVLVPVWVKDGKTVVQGLTESDFELTDNGVRQEVTSIATSSQPSDVTVVLDTSGSLDAKSLETLKTGIRRIGQSLMAQDRIRLLTFATKVTEVFGFQPGGVAPPVERVGAGGMTALYDAFGAALTVRAEERPAAARLRRYRWPRQCQRAQSRRRNLAGRLLGRLAIRDDRTSQGGSIARLAAFRTARCT